jgi:hypothetical protein
MKSSTRAAGVPSGIANIGHECPTVDTPRTLVSAALVITMIVLSCVASGAVYTAILRPPNERSPTPITGKGLVLPNEPRLEGIEKMSAATPTPIDDHLQKYGWVDREKKIVHIPIQRAMDLAIERGWLRGAKPTRNSAPNQTDSPKTSADKSSMR